MATAPHGVSSEVGPLATVMLHRPGSELRRLTPRNNDELLFDGVPWVSRAQHEHDAFADALRARGVEVLYVRDLLEATLDVPAAREQLLAAALDPQWIGPTLAAALGERLGALGGAELAEVLVAGLAREELREDSAGSSSGWPRRRTSSCARSRTCCSRATRACGCATASRSRRSRWARAAARPRSLARSTRHHPRFAGTPLLYGGDPERDAWLEGGDVLVLAPGVLAVGVGQRTEPGGRRGVRPAAVRGGGGAHRARSPDRAGPGHDAPRHRLHDGPPRRGRHVPAAGGLAGGLRARGGRRLRPLAVPGRRGRGDGDPASCA